MPKGIYPRKQRTRDDIVASLRRRIGENSIPEPNSGCWIFTGYLDELGYGIISEVGKVRIKAHRAAYTAFKCEIPHGLDVLHSCDLRCCVNPEHLRIGTHQDNMDDKVKRGRARNGTTKKWELQLAEIRSV